MQTQFIPHKTPLGQDELRTRANKLDARVRALLIQIDGSKSLLQLQPFGGEQFSEYIAKLSALGLIRLDESLAAQRQIAH